MILNVLDLEEYIETIKGSTHTYISFGYAYTEEEVSLTLILETFKNRLIRYKEEIGISKRAEKEIEKLNKKAEKRKDEIVELLFDNDILLRRGYYEK